MTADYPQPRELAWCQTYAIKPENEKRLYEDIRFRGQSWRVKRSKDPWGWLGPVVFKYEAEAGYDVIAYFASFDLLIQFMDDYDMIIGI